VKRIFSNLLSLFVIPLLLTTKIKKTLIKSKIDNFIGGLLIGAIVSLLVNYITFNIQDNLQRQRILEAVENEILTNTINANSLISSNRKEIEANRTLNYFYTSPSYSSSVWNSSGVLNYIVQLPKEDQIKLFGYYFTTERINSLINKTEKIRETNASKCTALMNDKFTVPDMQYCVALNRELLNEDNSSAYNIAKQGLDTLHSFHPTSDRLKNPILKFFLGSDAVNVLKH